MNQTEQTNQVPLEIKVAEAAKLLKAYGLPGEVMFMSKEAVDKLCGPPVESRRISQQAELEHVMKTTGRFPYVVFAFVGQGGAVCVPDANYYVRDGIYDVHIVRCTDGGLCAEVANNVAAVFRVPLPKEALLRLADEQTLCQRHVLPPHMCRPRTEPAHVQTTAPEELPAPPPPPPQPAPARPSSMAATRIKETIQQLMQQQQRQTAEAPKEPVPEEHDVKAVLKANGLGWLAQAVENVAVVSALRFVLENKDLLDALMDPEKREELVRAAKGAPQAPGIPGLEKWSAKDRQKLAELVSQSADLDELFSKLAEEQFGEDCTADVVRYILSLAEQNGGMDCRSVKKKLRW